MRKLNNKGFGFIGVLAVIVVLAAAGGAGAYVYHKNHKAKPAGNTSSSSRQSTQAGSTNTSTGKGSGPGTPSQQNYLVVKELGIRFKLAPDISSAYYAVKSSSQNGKPVIALYLHSLDSYPQCTPAQNDAGVAEIETFTPGQVDPVAGDFSSSYPNAPLINGLHYYIANEQYDCSDGRASNFSAIRQAFRTAYPTIEAYSGN